MSESQFTDLRSLNVQNKVGNKLCLNYIVFCKLFVVFLMPKLTAKQHSLTSTTITTILNGVTKRSRL